MCLTLCSSNFFDESLTHVILRDVEELSLLKMKCKLLNIGSHEFENKIEFEKHSLNEVIDSRLSSLLLCNLMLKGKRIYHFFSLGLGAEKWQFSESFSE